MNIVVEEALRRELGIFEDDLHRAKMQKRLDPTWVSGNGQSIDEVIAGYEQRVQELRKALQEEARC